MSFRSEHRPPPEIEAELKRKRAAGNNNWAWTALTALLAVVAAIMLLIPADFHETIERPSGLTKSRALTCGSVVSPHTERTEDGFSRYPDQCTAMRTQRVGYAGLTLAAAVVVMAVGVAVRRRRSGSAADGSV